MVGKKEKKYFSVTKMISMGQQLYCHRSGVMNYMATILIK